MVRAVNWSKNPIPVELITDLDVANNNVRIRLEVAIFNGSDTQIGGFTVEEAPDTTGKVLFDLSGALDDAMRNNWQSVHDWPNELNKIHGIDGSPMKISVNMIEMQNGIEESYTSLNTILIEDSPQWIYIFQGGLNAETIMAGYDYWTDLFELVSAAENPFLTWNVEPRTVDRKQLIPLHFLTNAETSGIYGKFVFYHYDLPLGNFETDSVVLASKYRVLCMNAGMFPYLRSGELNLSGIETDITGPITRYTFQLFDGTDTAISEELEFVLDDFYHRNCNYFIYQNSLNGFNDVRFIGEVETNIANERSSSAFAAISETVPPTGVRSVVNTSEQWSIKVNTGAITPTEADKLRELLLSPRIYRYVPSMDKRILFIPMELTDKSKTLLKSSDYLNNITLEFVNQFKNVVYTSKKFVEALVPVS